MPYKVKGNCVYKKDSGAKVGCTKGDVKKYLAALHANANEAVNESDKIKGGLADKITSKDIANKFNIPVNNIKQQMKMGEKVELEHTSDHSLAKEIATDHLVEIPDYYTRLADMEKEGLKHWRSKEVNESTKILIKRLIRERMGLFLVDETPEYNTYDILIDQKPVGKIVLGQINKGFGKDTLEIIHIGLSKEVNHLDVARKAITSTFEKFPDINRIVMQPKPESRDFWYKLDGQRIDSKYMIILRAH